LIKFYGTIQLVRQSSPLALTQYSFSIDVTRWSS
jgi:hypothetical protein